jgi:hypothetical protein
VSVPDIICIASGVKLLISVSVNVVRWASILLKADAAVVGRKKKPLSPPSVLVDTEVPIAD